MAKIMVVDDEPDLIFLVRKILEKEGHEVIEADGGKECLEKLKTERPDLILLDVMMPDIDGWEVSKRIKADKELKSIPIAMLTVRTSEGDKSKSFQEAYANAHIDKPIIREKLIKTIEWLLEHFKKESSS